MLTPAERELVAKSIDGGLSAAEEATLRHLYAAGPEAKRLRKLLKQDREALHRLAKVDAPKALLPAVMARVTSTDVFETIPGSTLRKRPRRSLVGPLTIAASVLFCVGLVGFGYLLTRRHLDHVAETAQHHEQAQSLPKDLTGRGDDRIALNQDPDDTEPDSPNETPKSNELAPTPKVVPPATPPAVYASPLVTPPKLDSVIVKLPLIVAADDLPRDDIQKRLTTQLSQQSPMRVDVFGSGDTAKAVEALLNRAKAAGLSVTVDAVSQERLKRKLPGAWMLYTDSLTPAEWTTLLTKLAPPADASPSMKVFDTLHVLAAGTADKKDLKDIMGLDTASKKPNAQQPLSANTLEQVSRTLGTPPAKEALLLTFLPQGMRTPQGQSKEIAAWMARQRDPKPGTVGVMVVIR